jgi:hypothetical protein
MIKTIDNKDVDSIKCPVHGVKMKVRDFYGELTRPNTKQTNVINLDCIMGCASRIKAETITLAIEKDKND